MSAFKLRKMLVGVVGMTVVLAGGLAQAATQYPPEEQLNNPGVPVRACDFDQDRISEECFDTNGDDWDDVIRSDGNGNGRAEFGIVDSDFDHDFEWTFTNDDDNATWDAAYQDVDGDGMDDHAWHRQNNGTVWRQDF